MKVSSFFPNVFFPIISNFVENEKRIYRDKRGEMEENGDGDTKRRVRFVKLNGTVMRIVGGTGDGGEGGGEETRQRVERFGNRRCG